MSNVVENITNVIEAKNLPESPEFLYELMSGDRSRFEYQEYYCWDYKASWPFSYSDDYFGGIVRLILAYHNSYGGLVIFNVDDKTGAHSRSLVKPNIERLNNVLRTHVDGDVVCIHKRYPIDGYGDVDVLLVPKKQPFVNPARTNKVIGSYKKGTIWIRRAHEVLEAESKDLSVIYGSEHYFDQNNKIESTLLGYMPPKVSTVKTFVGRMAQLDQLFSWFLLTDEPRTFLYGTGGSGKTTIAYEFADFIRSNGANLKIKNQDNPEIVIFVSAKERSLDSISAGVRSDNPDFSNESELLESILLLSDFYPLEQITPMSIDEKREAIKDLFNSFSCLLVIDDVDTLTTRGIDPGFDFLFMTACRARRSIKLLYTLRNAPTQALANSIEVPGLAEDGEFDAFVEACARQFRVDPPCGEHILERFKITTERRPLIIETIMGIRRSVSSYDEALNLFDERGGDEARQYTFSREWGALLSNNQARNVLLCIALFGKPISSSDIASILTMDAQSVSESILVTQEMFLLRENAGDDTKFNMGHLTREFVLKEGRTLKFYDKIVARVKLYKQNDHKKPPQVHDLEIRCRKAIRAGNPKSALTIIKSSNFGHQITEHPAYLSLMGWVLCNQSVIDFPRVRECFNKCRALSDYVDPHYAKTWLIKEREYGFGGEVCDDICNWIIGSRNQTDRVKAEFYLSLASQKYERALALEYVSSTDFLQLIRDALVSHLISYDINLKSQAPTLERSYRYTSSTARKYFYYLAQGSSSSVWQLFDFWIDCAKELNVISYTPLVDGMSEAISRLVARRDIDNSRMQGRLRQFKEALLSNKFKFEDETSRETLMKALSV